jgi:hypothetical protein
VANDGARLAARAPSQLEFNAERAYSPDHPTGKLPQAKGDG